MIYLKKHLSFFLLTLFCFMQLAAFNRSLFFRTSSFWDEPRLEKPYLGTVDTQLLGGSNHKGHNGCNKKTNLLSIYGPENIKGLSQSDPEHPLYLPLNPHQICFLAVADVFEADINLYQNFSHGFFMHFHLPIILLQLYPSGYLENECCKHKTSKHYQPAWQKSFKPLAQFLHSFDLSLCPQRDAGLSDSTLFIGWTKSFQNTCYLDFIDFTAQTGVLLPTGKKKDIHEVFSIPYGYNGHWAIPLSGDISFGFFDWLTLGLHADNLFFFKKKECVRMKADHQTDTGFIRLAQGPAVVDQGILWRVGTYVKADHFYNGLSFLFGFSYEQQNRSHIYPCDTIKFSTPFVNDDEQLKKWDRSIFHIAAEYDFTHEESCIGPRLGFFYDRQMTGKRVFDISTLGGYVGIDVNWRY